MALSALLAEIVENKAAEVDRRKRELPLEAIKEALPSLPRPRDFEAALRDRTDVRLIAEMKRRSPSSGVLVDLYDPRILAQEYAGNGAAALSVLTDEKYFAGQITDVRRARELMPLPILRKDFLLEPYQVYESRYYEADAVLLIVAVLEGERLVDMLRVAAKLGMAALVECHDEEEVERALKVGAGIIGINNRNLATLEVDLGLTERLAPLIPDDYFVVAESGLQTRADLERLAAAGIDAALIGTALMRDPDPGAVLRQFTRVPRSQSARAAQYR
jgi:indole-3-glycerol phosphate synthase